MKVTSLLLALTMAAAAVPHPSLAESRNVDGIWLDDGESLKEVALPPAGPLTLDGWTRRGRGDVYRLKVKAGQTVKIELAASSEFVLMAVFDFSMPDEDAIFFSDSQGKVATLTPKADTEWLIRPTLILGSPRRGLGAHYILTVSTGK
ncbi:hypothetical protein G6L68_02880 [Agrobacterium fabrum]|uniref:hypothetical protein n=1 Tax=Agrobacterium fabrum TaxID=1176649 RepID=UPI000EF627DD|nr:hypothetical protein [Agrobacterium fabrum]AYM61478.1 hypothetical protein At12D13_03130 [Agrobacterium fabrum]NTE59580.1 hypothetical protein [Agrobacterium fabrum]